MWLRLAVHWVWLPCRSVSTLWGVWTMCLAVFYLDTRRNPAFVCYETRDMTIHRAHGSGAADGLGITVPMSYDRHWQRHPGLVDRVWTVRSRADITAEPIVGGLDAGGGTWVACNERTGVYARVFVAPLASGVLGEANSSADRARHQQQGYVTRSGLCLDVATYSGAAAAVEALRRELPAALHRDGVRVQPFFLLIGDAHDAFVVGYTEDGTIEVKQAAENQVNVVSVRGLNSGAAALTAVLRERLAGTPVPGARPQEWDPWLAALGIGGWLDDATYTSPDWRGHRMTALQPPYLNVQGPDRHRRAPWPYDGDHGLLEWTKSSTCTAVGPGGLHLLMSEERHLAPGRPWPESLAEMAFPSSSADYAVLLAESTRHQEAMPRG